MRKGRQPELLVSSLVTIRQRAHGTASDDRHVKSRPRRMNAITTAADPGNQARRGPAAVAAAVKTRTATAFLRDCLQARAYGAVMNQVAQGRIVVC
jgi:hypothetical protein